MPDLVTKFSGNDADLVKAYERIQRENVKLRDQMRELKDASNDAHESGKRGAEGHSGAIDRAVGSIRSMVAGYFSVQAAIRLANAEMQHHIELQAKAAATQTGLANPRADLLQNLGNISPEEKKQVVEGLNRMAGKGYSSLSTLQTAGGFLASASPDLTNKERLETLEVAARFAPQEEQLPTIAAGLADVSGLTGSKDAMENLGVLAAMGAKSRSTSPAQVAEHLVPAAKNLRSFGDDVSSAAALPLAIQNATVDVEGRQSGTSAISLGEQLQKFFEPEEAEDRAKKKLTRELHLGELDQADEGLRGRVGEFFKGLTPEQLEGAGLRGGAKMPGDWEGQAELLKEFKGLSSEFLKRESAEGAGLGEGALSRFQREFPALAKGLEAFEATTTPGQGASDRDRLRAYAKEGLDADTGQVVESFAAKDKGGAPQSTAARIKFLQEHPEMAEEFLSTASFERKPAEQIRNLLRDRESAIAKQYTEFSESGIPQGDAARRLGEQQIGVIEDDPLIRQQRRARSLKNVAEINRMEDLERGGAAITREGLAGVLESTGMGGVASKIKKAEFEIGSGLGDGNFLEEAQRQIEDRQFELQYRVRGITDSSEGAVYRGAGEDYARPIAIDEAEGRAHGDQVYIPRGGDHGARQAELLEAVIENLKAMRGDLKEAEATRAAADRAAGARGDGASRRGREAP